MKDPRLPYDVAFYKQKMVFYSEDIIKLKDRIGYFTQKVNRGNHNIYTERHGENDFTISYLQRTVKRQVIYTQRYVATIHFEEERITVKIRIKWYCMLPAVFLSLVAILILCSRTLDFRSVFILIALAAIFQLWYGRKNFEEVVYMLLNDNEVG